MELLLAGPGLGCRGREPAKGHPFRSALTGRARPARSERRYRRARAESRARHRHRGVRRCRQGGAQRPGRQRVQASGGPVRRRAPTRRPLRGVAGGTTPAVAGALRTRAQGGQAVGAAGRHSIRPTRKPSAPHAGSARRREPRRSDPAVSAPSGTTAGGARRGAESGHHRDLRARARDVGGRARQSPRSHPRLSRLGPRSSPER